MEILEFIKENFLILVAVLWVIGYAIKHTKLIKDEFIPIIIIVLGSLLGSILALQTDLTLFDGILQGLLCGGASVGASQIPIQLNKLK